MAKKIIAFGLILFATLILYRQVFGVYFVGDDFFHFKVSQTDGSFLGFIKLFGFYPFSERGIAFYRPIFREALYNLSYNLWGLNQIPLRTASFLLHFGNVILVYLLFKRLFNSKIAFLTSFLFAISAANSGALYYLAGGLQTQGAAFFVLATLILFEKHKILAFLSFILSLMSHELAVAAPFLILGMMLVREKFKIKRLLPYLVVLAFYLFLDFKIIGFSDTEAQYGLVFNLKTIANSLFWYSLWSFGLPETLIDFVNPGFSLNPNLMKYWGNLYSVIFPAFFAALISLVLLIFLQRKQVKDKKLIFLAFWFVTGLGAVLLLPLHKSTQYLTISLPAFWGMVAYFLFSKNRIINILSFLFLASWAILTIYSIKVMGETFWAAQRGRISQRLITDIKSLYPTLPKGAVFYVENDPDYPFIAEDWGGTSKQASLILSREDALQLLYKDSSLKVYYQDLNPVPNDVKKGNIFKFTAKIN